MEILLLAAGYLVGLAALAIPVLLHLRPRTKQLLIRFSATRFLVPVLKRTARRLRFQNLVLMLLRVLLVALMVLAFTMPLIRSVASSALSFEAEASVVVVLDASLSMGYRDEDLTRFERAKAAAGRILEALDEDDDAAVVLAAATPEIVPPGLTRKVELLREQLPRLELTHSAADLRQALLTAGEVLASSRQPTRHVFVFTDLQRSGLASLRTKPLPPEALGRANLTLVDLGSDGAANSALVRVDVLTSHRAVDVPLEFLATAKHFGPTDVDALATLVFGGRREAERALQITPGGEATAQFTHTFRQAAFQVGAIELSPDSLAADDRRHVVVKVGRPTPVLCVDGDLSNVEARQETFYVRTALHPAAPAGPDKGDKGDRPKPVVCAPGEFERMNLDDYRVVLLANVPDLSAKMVALLEKFTTAGGGLWIFLGDRVRPEAYNKRLWSPDGGLLPMKLTAPIGRADRRNPMKLAKLNTQHPLLARFRDNVLGDLSHVDVYQAIGVDMESRVKGALVLARYEDGSPAIVEGTFGRGKVLLWTTSVDADWTNLPVEPVFVPLVHETAHYLGAESHARADYLVGQTIRVPLDIESTEATVQVTNPAGKTFAARLRTHLGRLAAEFAETDAPGVYEITVREGARSRTEMVAVNVDPAESDLTRLDKDALADCFHPKHQMRTTDPANLASALAEGREGSKVWIGLLYLALIIYIVEVLYAGRLSAEADPPRGATTPAPATE